MKKLIYFTILTVLAFSCEEYNDQFEGYDDSPITLVENIEYTLTDEDYEEIGGDPGDSYYFNESNPPADFIPDFLAGKYPALDVNSAVNVTYKYSTGYPDLSKYSNADYYELNEEDYGEANQIVGNAGYFTPENPAEDFLPGILNTAVPNPEEGKVYIISYMYSDVEPEIEVSENVVFEYDFESSLGDFTSVNVLGDDQDWYHSSYQGTGYAKMSGYSGGAVANEDWLVSPEIDLSGITNSTISVNQAINYLNNEWEQIKILISSNYQGADPSSASWTELIPSNKPEGNSWSFIESEAIDISEFDGETVHIAFKYTSSDSNAATWEVGNVSVKGMGTSSTKSGIIVDPVEIEEFYTYDSGWEKTEGAYYLKAMDYDAMGEPGAYNNFSSSVSPDNYLPQLLEQKYPYAQEGDEMVVVYKYYSGGVQTRADQYRFEGGSWMKYDPIEARTDQYLKTASGWLFDPTVLYTMTAEDYQIIVDYVKNNIGEEYVSSYGNNETYFGSNAYYVEFQIGDAYYHSSFASWEDAVKEAIGTAFLPEKFPDAVSQVEGVDVNYIITFAGYLNSMVDYTITFQCTKSGPNPEFEYVEGPALK